MIALKKNVFCIVEFGSSKITCIIFQLSLNSIKILGIGVEIARGIKNGIASNVKDVILSISRAVSKAENQYGKTVDNIYVVITGADIESEIVNQEALLSGRNVNEKYLHMEQRYMP